MALPNDSILVTPGSGATVATHLLGGKEYQVIMQAGPSGHILDSLPTYLAWANDVAHAQNKYHISILNPAASGKIVKLQKLFCVNLQAAAVTGVMERFDIFKITAHSVGTLITSEAFDSTNAAPSATVRTGATVTEGNKLFGFTTANEEVGATGTLISGTHILAGMNLLFEGRMIQEITLREGQGIAAKQITATTVGSFGWILVFTEE